MGWIGRVDRLVSLLGWMGLVRWVSLIGRVDRLASLLGWMGLVK